MPIKIGNAASMTVPLVAGLCESVLSSQRMVPNTVPAKTSKAPPKPASAPAPGGGPDKVWANENTKVYHCQGDRYYGTTKNGKYMTEAEAKAAGMHASRNKACS